jgi:Domain of unknown function (DUF4386)
LTSARKGVQLNPQTIARVTGVLFLITFIASIPAAFVLYAPVLDDPRYIVGAGADTLVSLGALLEFIVVIANIGTAVVLFPILRRQNEILALGYVTSRVLESTIIMVGVFSLLSVVSLRSGLDPATPLQDLAGPAGADAALLVTAGKLLVALHDWTFLFGPGILAGVGNGMLLGYLMYRSALVPRGMAVLGLIGGPVLVAAAVAILFGVIEAGSVWQVIATLPEALWELSLGIWLIVKGFNSSAVARLQPESQ